MTGEKEDSMRRLVVLCAILVTSLAAAPTAHAQLGTTDLSTLTPTQLANALVGSGVTVSNVTYTGANVAGGLFTGGTGIIGFGDGVVLGSGNIANVTGPNVDDGITTVNGTAGDASLDALVAPFTTNDASVLEFDFVPDADKVFFEYVFASDEYNEYVNSSFDDVFGFFVNGTNCAVVGTDRVSINTINNGNPFGSDPKSHPELYRNNDLQDGGGSINTEMDGLTVVLTCEASVVPNATNHMKLAIADTSDFVLDSNVFIKEGSLSTTPPSGSTCGEVRGDGYLDSNPDFRYVFYNVKYEEGAAKPSGEISFTDLKNKQSKVKFVSTSIDTLVIADGQATLTGSGMANGSPVTFKVVVMDGSPDTFSVELSNGYSASGNVTRGRGIHIKPC
jgi:hypothetical protein